MTFNVDFFASDGKTGNSRLPPIADIPLLYEVIGAHGGTIASLANPFLSLVDPAEYHVPSPVPSNFRARSLCTW